MAATEQVARIEGLLEEIDGIPDPGAQATATAVVQALLELYGEGLGRIVDIVAVHDDGTLAAAMGDDELVAHLLLLHDLHPEDVETRVARALDEVRPYLGSHGGDVELLGVADGVARVRLTGTCDGCPSSAATLQYAIEEAVARAAPELDGIEADGVAEPAPAQQLIQIGSLTCPTELLSR
jgi:Fe-S cluster biogenesis protein NfuA